MANANILPGGASLSPRRMTLSLAVSNQIKETGVTIKVEGSWNDRLLDAMVALWPKAFVRRRMRPVPLQIGIREAILELAEELALKAGVEPGAIEKMLHRALYRYVQALGYLKAVARGGKRRDLNGKKTEKVTEKEKLAAAETMELRKRAARKLRNSKPSKVPVVVIKAKRSARP